MPSQISFFDGSRKFIINKPIRLIELFGGIGSQAKALKNIGAKFEHYKLCEIDKYAIQSYNAIHGTSFETRDIKKLHGNDLDINSINDFIYLLTYSFPCTDLSAAGMKKGMSKSDNTRSGLLWEVERILTETRKLPQILLMENVPEVLNALNIKDFVLWRDFLESLGYKCYIDILNAKNYGIPQNRNRCFMVSLLGDYYYEFPDRIPLQLRLSDMLENEITDKYFLSQNMIKYFYSRKDRVNFSFRPKTKNGIASTITTRPDRPTETYILEDEDTDYLKKLFPATEIKSNPLPIEFGSAYGYYLNCRPDFEQPPMKDLARTLLTRRENNGVVYNGKIRRLTPLESFRLMGFSDVDFYACKEAKISETQIYKQAGNSIVVKVLEALLKTMFS